MRTSIAILAVLVTIAILTIPLCSDGQESGRVARVGVLGPRTRTDGAPFADAFRQGLRDLGWVEGKSIVIEYRWADGRVDRLADLAADLVRLKVDVILAGNTQAVLSNPGNPAHVLWTKHEANPAARSLGVQLQFLEARDPQDFESVFAAMARERATALLVLADSVFAFRRAQLQGLAAKSRLPAMYGEREYAEAGGLMSYGVDVGDNFRRSATYVDKILKGAKPGDLPVEQPSKFELIVNRSTAEALELKIPQSVLLRADEVIQ